MSKSKQVDVMMCAGCGVTLTPREAYHDDEARMLCLGCYDAWCEATFCEECGYRWDECTCHPGYEEHEDIGDLYPDEVEERYEVDDYYGEE